jgi:hypothetical protein
VEGNKMSCPCQKWNRSLPAHSLYRQRSQHTYSVAAKWSSRTIQHQMFQDLSLHPILLRYMDCSRVPFTCNAVSS